MVSTITYSEEIVKYIVFNVHGTNRGSLGEGPETSGWRGGREIAALNAP
jgi:hypothetical protein